MWYKKIPMLGMVLIMVGCTNINYDIVNITVNSPVGSFPVPIRDMQNPYRK